MNYHYSWLKTTTVVYERDLTFHPSTMNHQRYMHKLGVASFHHLFVRPSVCLAVPSFFLPLHLHLPSIHMHSFANTYALLHIQTELYTASHERINHVYMYTYTRTATSPEDVHLPSNPHPSLIRTITALLLHTAHTPFLNTWETHATLPAHLRGSAGGGGRGGG